MKRLLVVISMVLLVSGAALTTPEGAVRNLQFLVNNHIGSPQYSTFRITNGPHYWTAVKGDKRSFDVNLQVGKRYIFLASGDANSFDIDIRVYDMTGNIIAQDINTPQYDVNGTPLSGTTGIDAGAWYAPVTPGNYRVEVDLWNTNAMAGIIHMGMCWGEF